MRDLVSRMASFWGLIAVGKISSSEQYIVKLKMQTMLSYQRRVPSPPPPSWGPQTSCRGLCSGGVWWWPHSSPAGSPAPSPPSKLSRRDAPGRHWDRGSIYKKVFNFLKVKSQLMTPPLATSWGKWGSGRRDATQNSYLFLNIHMKRSKYQHNWHMNISKNQHNWHIN